MADSILQAGRVCYLTGSTQGLHKHHIYAGSRRKASEERIKGKKEVDLIQAISYAAHMCYKQAEQKELEG